MELSRIDRIYAKLPVTAKLADGSSVTISGVDVAALPVRSTPTGTTTWTASSYSAGVATVLLAGPDADSSGAIPIPDSGADLWIRVVDSPEVEAVKVERVIVEGGGAATVPTVTLPVTSVNGRTGGVVLTATDVGAVSATGLTAAIDAEGTAKGWVSDLSVFGVYMPEKYGALGDGVTDDTTAVQTAVTNCPTNGRVYFSKQYLISAAITLPQNKEYIGTGGFNSGVLVKAGTNPVAALLSAAYASNSTTSGGPVVVRDLLVKYQAGNTSGHGILLLNYNSEVSGCNVSSTPGAGIVMADQNAAGTTISNTAVENRIVNNKVNQPGTHGVWVQDTAGSGKNTDGYLQSNIVSFSGDVAIRNERSAGWFIDDNHVYACGNGGAPASLATIAGAGGFHLANCWNTYVTNNEADGFGAVTNGGTHIAFNIEQLTGRPSVILGNVASANEGLHTASSYIYYRVKNTTGSGATVRVMMPGNVAHCDTTGGASSVWASFQPNSGTLRVKLGETTIDGPGAQTIGSPGTVAFTGAEDLAPGGNRDTYSDYGNRAVNIVETMSRDSIDPTSGSPSPSAGTLALTYFTPDQSVTVSNLMSATRGTAQAGATLAKMALFTVDGSGNLTCIARTASDTTLWQSTQNAFTRAIADDGQGSAVASVALTRGQRYAFGILHVGSTTAPTLAGKGGIAALLSASPRRGGFVTGQTDVPSSITAATISAGTTSGNYYYGRCS